MVLGGKRIVLGGNDMVLGGHEMVLGCNERYCVHYRLSAGPNN